MVIVDFIFYLYLHYKQLINLINFNLGLAIFKSYSRPNENNKDPFRPVELNIHKGIFGAPARPSAKPRKPSRILKTTASLGVNHNASSIQKRNTKRIRKNIRNSKVLYYKLYE
jgi:hypothetical protein